MKQITTIILILLLAGCSKYAKESGIVENQNFEGKIPQYLISMKVRNDSVFAYWILIDKFPRKILYDTLKKSNNENCLWIGRKSSFQKIKTNIFFPLCFMLIKYQKELN
jgi:acetoacetate decarboxylase